MAERKAVNKYYPPEWTPAQGSINKFRGTHALRERARKLHLGILVIRFEMPFNIWCNGCEKHIGMGVRYNAEKTKVGMYYTTPVYKFRMKCHLCSNHFEIQTDPQNLDYVILEGARRQERRWDPTQNEQVAPEEREVSQQLAADPMFRLEHGERDRSRQKALLPCLGRLEDHRGRWKDDYLLNRRLRDRFREKKKVSAASDRRDASLLKKYSLDIALVPESGEDRKLAGLLKLTSVGSLEDKERARAEDLLSAPIFPPPGGEEKSALASFVRESKVKELLRPITRSELGIVAKSGRGRGQSGSRTSLVAFDYDSSGSSDSS